MHGETVKFTSDMYLIIIIIIEIQSKEFTTQFYRTQTIRLKTAIKTHNRTQYLLCLLLLYNQSITRLSVQLM